MLQSLTSALVPTTLPIPGESVSSILASPRNSTAAVVNPDSIHLWKTSVPLSDLKIAAKVTGDPKFSPSGKLLAARTGPGAVRVWSAETGYTVANVEVNYDIVSFAFSPDESVLGIASTGTVELWPLDTAAKRPVGAIPSAQSIADIAFLPDGELLVGARGGNSFLTPWRREDLIQGVCSVLTRKPAALTPAELQTYGLAGNYHDYCSGKTVIARR